MKNQNFAKASLCTQKGSVAVILLIILVLAGGVYWYISWKTEKEERKSAIEAEIPDPSLEDKKDIDDENKKVQIEGGFIDQAAFAKYGSDLFLVHFVTYHNDYSGNETYHIDLDTGETNKIDTPYLVNVGGEFFGMKYFDIDYEYDSDYEGRFGFYGYRLNEDRIKDISRELDIPEENLTIKAFGDKPKIGVVVKTKYDPDTKKTTIIKGENPYFPYFCNPEFCDKEPNKYYLGDEVYPTDDFKVISVFGNYNKYIEVFDFKVIFSDLKSVLTILY
jgi:hypothetical protein